MTKVIAGEFKGRTLNVPKTVTRPTSSRVREAMFSTLQHALGTFEEVQVLDLFAGSGALGIEAASRGAAKVDFVESDVRAITVIQENLKRCKCLVGFTHSANVGTFLERVGSPGSYNVVFLDPPYAMHDNDLSSLLVMLATKSWLAEDAIVVVERDRRSQFKWPEDFADIAVKAYGDTAIWYGHYVNSRTVGSSDHNETS